MLVRVIWTLILLGGVFPVAAGAAVTPPKALILSTSVAPGTATDGSGKSLEQQQAEADGFTVTVVDAATWDAMTAADFATYQVLIIGDPSCGGPESFAAAQMNATTWEPVVMRSGGNKVLIGTDPTFHNDGPTGTKRGDLLEANGIAFAGAVPGATGAYIDLTCAYETASPGTPVPLLDGLSSHGAGQFTVGGAPCTGTIAIVAQSGPTAGLHDADLSNWSCSVHEFFDKFPSDWTPLALATDPGVPKTYSATDVDTGATVSGSPYILVSGGGVTVTSNISLSPATATNPAGTDHTVTATVTSAPAVAAGTVTGTPVVGTTVTFTVESGPNTGKTGTGVTNSSGQATFTYHDDGGVGTDLISATFTDTGGALEKATATKTWVATGDAAVTATGQAVSATEGAAFTGQVASFTDPDTAALAGDYTASIDWGDGSPSSNGTLSGSGGTFAVSGTHTYAEEGSFPIVVTVTDADSPSNSATSTGAATVADAGLTASGATLPAVSPLAFTGTVATFTDANPLSTPADFAATIDWGDGQTSTGTVSGSGGSYSVSASHSYAAGGSFAITVTIADDGGAGATATTTTTLVEGVPAVTSVTPASGSTAGGTGVVVFGRGLAGAKSVHFGSVAGVVLGVSPDGTRLTALVPPGSGTVDVTVTTPFGTSPTSAADLFTYVAPQPGGTTTGGTTTGGTTTGGTTTGGTTTGGTTTGGTTTGGTTTGGSTTGGASGQSPGQPKTATGPPKVISSSSAVFTATINPQGLPTTMHFEYKAELAGASAAAITYDARTPEQPVGSDFADHTVTATVANLLPNSTYHFRAVAANPSGVAPSLDATFKTATDPPPPPPVLGKSVNATPVSGTVLVLLPGQGHISSAGAHASAVKGVGFIPLTEARQLPVGTIFDTSAGVARLTSATAVKGAIQSGDFSAGVFKLLQDRRQKGLTELDLVEGKSTTAKCAAPIGKAQTAARRALPKTVLNLLRATAKGKFKTQGKYSSATVRGTTWTTSDRCDGTLTAVKRGVVVVSDLRRRRQIVVRAGRAYLAKAP